MSRDPEMVKQIGFTCDVDGCRIEPHRAPVLMVPAKLMGPRLTLGNDYSPLKMHTTVHYCERHRLTLDTARLIETLLTLPFKLGFEDAAKKKRALDFKCDFDKAYLTWELVTTPEYRRFLAALGHDGVMGAAKLSPDQQRSLRARLGLLRVAG